MQSQFAHDSGLRKDIENITTLGYQCGKQTAINQRVAAFAIAGFKHAYFQATVIVKSKCLH